MQQIINFFLRNKNFLLFCFLLAISIALTIQSHSYHKGKFISSANFFSGGIYSMSSSVSEYFGLKNENQILLDENTQLRSELEAFKLITNLSVNENLSEYKYINAWVINNSFSKTKNKITLRSGRNQGIKEDMGVITSKGIVGIINKVSDNYSTVLSILNTQSEINAKLKKTDHFGILKWDTKDPNMVQLVDIQRLAPVKIGDTIITGGRSTIFPKGIRIGLVKDFKLDQGGNTLIINVKLFNDMTSLGHVYIIENTDAKEIKELEENQENE